MDWGITFLNELQELKKKMDQTWNELVEKAPGKEPEVTSWIDKLPKFEGTGRTPKSRSKKTIRPL